MYRVTGGRRHPGADGTGLADALLDDLAIEGFAVAEDGANVFRFIALTHTGVYAHLLEQIGHTEGAGLVGDNGHYPGPQLFVF